MNMEILPLIWAAILGMGVTLYVLLDGFSLGVGILFPSAQGDERRDMMMSSVAPVWDGNQTWLVGNGAALFAAFPQAFNLLLSVLYLPLMVMLLALVFRGTAFEFRFKAKRKVFWDRSFAIGSTTAAFCQGVVLGLYVQGFTLENDALLLNAGGYLNAFSLLTGVAVVCAYAMLGACWLILKTEGELHDWARRRARQLFPAVVLAMAVVSLMTPWMVPEIAAFWFSWPHALALLPIPLWSIGVLAALWWSLGQHERWDGLPFLCCIGLFLLMLAGLAVSIWPHIVPQVFTFTEVAAPAASLEFVLVGVLLIVPVILLYTAHAYYVFRGKVRALHHY